MKIRITLEASETTGSETVTLDDLGIEESAWSEMDYEAQKDAIAKYVDNMHNQPFWVVEDFNEDD
jgi:hypothetical protein